MKRYPALTALLFIAGLLSACLGRGSFTCTDPLGCVVVKPNEALKIATILTMSGSDQVYGIDAVRGVEIAISDQGRLLGHSIELVQTDDRCEETGGQEAAEQVAADPQILGAIGATCSSASVPAAKILSEAGMVMISPSSTAPSLTDPVLHQPGFFRSIYNDKAQARVVAEFAFQVLGLQRMVTLHDGTPYPKELQQDACDAFEQLGGDCLQQVDLSSGQDVLAALQLSALQNPDVLYYPVYTDDGIAITTAIKQAGLSNTALISSDGLISSDFIQKTRPQSQGMYLSGPAVARESESFTLKYTARYGEDPIATYHLQAYDAAGMLFNAIQQAAVVSGNQLYIQRQKLRDALYGLRGWQGLSGPLTCSPLGDCAEPNIEIFQIVGNNFRPIFP